MALLLAAEYGVSCGAVDPVNNCVFFFFVFFDFYFCPANSPTLAIWRSVILRCSTAISLQAASSVRGPSGWLYHPTTTKP